MLLANETIRLGFADSALVALLGYAMVFFGLFLLMLVVTVMGKIFVALDARKQKAKAAPAAASAAPAPVSAAAEEAKPVAPGSAGELKLHDVEPKTAAMLMAIVANQMGKPINELRFISIKEVKSS